MEARPAGTVDDPPATPWSRLAAAGTAVNLLLAVAGALLLRHAAAPPERRWEALAFPLVWAAPALLALLARRRPVLLVPAGALSAVLSVFSLSGVTLLLLVPAGLFIAGAARARLSWPGPARTAVVLALPLGGLAAIGALFVHQDPVCWDVVREPGGGEAYRTRPDRECGGASGSASGTVSGPVLGGGSTSDTVVAGEAAVSALFVAVTLAVGWAAAGPGRAR